MKMGEAMYKQQQEAAGAAGTAGSEQAQAEQPKDETVVDADFEEVKK